MVLLRRLPLLEDLERPYDVVGLYRGTGVEEVATGQYQSYQVLLA